MKNLQRGLVVLALVLAACSRKTSSTLFSGDAPGDVEISVRVPAALSVARAIDTLSVAIDPASLGRLQLTAHSGMVIGVEADVLVFRKGDSTPVLERRRVGSSADFSVCSSAWRTDVDGIPAPGAKYVVEMGILLFETDAAPTQEWDPRAGNFATLWTRTLRQAEE
jgi:hypothetical protein